MLSPLLEANLVGLIAACLGVAKYQVAARNSVLWFNVGTGAAVCAQFVLLSAWPGAAMALASGCSSLVAIAIGRKAPYPIRLGFGALAVTGLILFDSASLGGAWAWLPIGAFAWGRFAETFRDHRLMRLAFMPAALFWLVYSTHAQAYGGALLEVATLASNAVGLIRFRRAQSP